MNSQASITALMSSFGRAFHTENEVHSPIMALYRPSLGGYVWMSDGSSELSEFQKRCAKMKVSSVDIPTGWDPRTKQHAKEKQQR